MASNISSKLLLSISETDQKILILSNQKDDLERRRSEQLSEIKRNRQLVEETGSKMKDSRTRQGVEEGRLRDEEKKIVDRRKQLTTLGGAKSAKLVEREIDIATKAMGTLEERVLKAIEDADQQEKAHGQYVEELERLEKIFEAETPASDERLGVLRQELEALTAVRDEVITQLDQRTRDLYSRVRSRYPAGAVAVADNGSCRSCYRSLPSQVFNQVLEGALLIQCPGCSRILVANTQPAE